MEKIRTADYYCDDNDCDFWQGYIGPENIYDARQRVIRHHKKTGHIVHFVITTEYVYGEEST